MSVRIEPLSEIGSDDFRRIVTGYESGQSYELTKTETRERTEISLRLVDLAEPFVKKFPVTSQMIAWYGSVLADELSFGAHDGERLFGIAIAQKQWNGVGMVWEIHVEKPLRGQGTGRRLLGSVEDAARAAGLRAVSIETQTSNVPAVDFYRACGYSVGAIDLSFYHNDDAERGEAALFMKKPIG